VSAYYNEIDPFAAAWLRELIKAGLIADGEVDERSIADVRPDDLRGFTQCHFFAGIGGWSYALRLAGWPDDRPAWTGSCPCQPFSSAGRGDGAADPRHLWPTWFRLIAECRPSVVFGEQVASADGLGWFDRVSDDMEGEDYAIGAVDLCAPCVGAFDIRQRLWFVADTMRATSERRAGGVSGAQASRGGARELDGCGTDGFTDGREVGALADSRHRAGRRSHAGACREEAAARPEDNDSTRHGGEVGLVGVSTGGGCERQWDQPTHSQSMQAGAWSDAEWIACRDGKYRPVEPGTFPLAHGVPARVGRLRGYGNAIKPPLAAEFIKAYREAIGEDLHGL
jgi:DNA (cytosine-5)-methyltransferase 1